jgi:hypothetical protein
MEAGTLLKHEPKHGAGRGKYRQDQQGIEERAHVTQNIFLSWI